MIIRGTTPPIRFTFSDVNPLEMAAAFLTVPVCKRCCRCQPDLRRKRVRGAEGG